MTTPDDLVKLAPCPFCGCTDIFVEPDERGSGGQWVGPIHVGCKACKCEQYADEESDAIAAWNSRIASQKDALQTAPVQQALTDHVPGIMRCAKCKFRLTRISLNVNVGTVTVGDNAPEHCPNGCGPMWPVSWRQEAEENCDLLESMFERATAAETALADLQSRLGPRIAQKACAPAAAVVHRLDAGTIAVLTDAGKALPDGTRLIAAAAPPQTANQGVRS